MPLIVAAALIGIPSVGLLFKTVTDETQQTVSRTGPDLVVLAAAGLGLFAAFTAIRRLK